MELKQIVEEFIKEKMLDSSVDQGQPYYVDPGAKTLDIGVQYVSVELGLTAETSIQTNTVVGNFPVIVRVTQKAQNDLDVAQEVRRFMGNLIVQVANQRNLRSANGDVTGLGLNVLPGMTYSIVPSSAGEIVGELSMTVSMNILGTEPVRSKIFIDPGLTHLNRLGFDIDDEQVIIER